MRPPTRATRSSRAADLEETEAQQPVGRAAKTQSRPTSSRSSRTGTPYSDKDKKPRHRMTDKQLERLEMLYELDTHPTREQKQALGDEVGMDTRTVTVWFQNRRQLSKKNSSIVTAAPQLMSRQPLGTVSHRNMQVSSRQHSVVSSVSQSSIQDHRTPQPFTNQLKRELWEYLPSSPPASSLPVSAATSAMPSPLAKKLSGARRSGKENIGADGRKRKPILEWACARVSKRQRVDPDEDGDLTEDELVDILDTANDGEESERTLVDIDLSGKRKKLSGIFPASASLTAVTIPPEYNDKFAPDVVLGASLLLTFQYSVKA